MLPATEHVFTSWDASNIFYRHWTTPSPTLKKKAIFLFHRNHEHSGRWQSIIDRLALNEFDIFAWDARGSGKTKDCSLNINFDCFIKDANCFIRLICDKHKIDFKNVIVMGHGEGAVIASTWAHDYAPPVRSLILINPAFSVNLYRIKLCNPLVILILKILSKFKPKLNVRSYIKGKHLTQDKEQIANYDNDILIKDTTPINLLLGAHIASKRVIKDSNAIVMPTLILNSGNDLVVTLGEQRTFYNGLASIRKEMQTFDGFYHDLLNETKSEKVLLKIKVFINDLFERPFYQMQLQDADKKGYTFDELQQLKNPIKPIYKRFYFAIAKYVISTVGRLSYGVNVGYKDGVDSNSMLQHIYQNKPNGITFIGKYIDKYFLSRTLFIRLRLRRLHLEQTINELVDKLLKNNEKVNIVDLGLSHNILDAIIPIKDKINSILIIDNNQTNVRKGEALIRDIGINQAYFKLGDTLDISALEHIDNKPNLAIICGTYEKYTSNNMLVSSLTDVAKKLESQSYIIYTNHSWAPEHEFLTEVFLSDKDIETKVMRRRTQLELDQLVRNSGFKKISMLIDEDGMFSVSVAKKL